MRDSGKQDGSRSCRAPHAPARCARPNPGLPGRGQCHREYHREYSTARVPSWQAWRGSTASTRGRRGGELGAHAGLFIVGPLVMVQIALKAFDQFQDLFGWIPLLAAFLRKQKRSGETTVEAQTDAIP